MYNGTIVGGITITGGAGALAVTGSATLPLVWASISLIFGGLLLLRAATVRVGAQQR